MLKNSEEQQSKNENEPITQESATSTDASPLSPLKEASLPARYNRADGQSVNDVHAHGRPVRLVGTPTNESPRCTCCRMAHEISEEVLQPPSHHLIGGGRSKLVSGDYITVLSSTEPAVVVNAQYGRGKVQVKVQSTGVILNLNRTEIEFLATKDEWYTPDHVQIMFGLLERSPSAAGLRNT